MRILLKTGLVLGLLMASANTGRAQVWTNVSANGNWEIPGFWMPAGIPDGADVAVYFTNNITAGRTVTISAATRTVGSVTFDDAAPGNAWTLARSSTYVLILDALAGNAAITSRNGPNGGNNSHIITAPVALNDPLVVEVASNSTFRLSGVISGNQPVTLQGGGTLVLEGANSVTNTSAGISVNQSVLRACENNWNTALFGGNLLLNDANLQFNNAFGNGWGADDYTVGNFNRTIGTGTGQVQFAGATVGFLARRIGNGGGGFHGGVNLNNDGSTLQAGSAAFPATRIKLNVPVDAGALPDAHLWIRNSLDLNGQAVTIRSGPSDRLQYTGPVDIVGASGIIDSAGGGSLTISGGSLLTVANGINLATPVTVDGGHVSFGAALPATNIVLRNDGMIYARGSCTNGLGTGAGQIDIGSSALGLGARDGDLAVSLGGNTATVNASAFNSVLNLNSVLANGQVDLLNPLNIDTTNLTVRSGIGARADAGTFDPAGYFGSAYVRLAAVSGSGNLTIGGGPGGLIALTSPSTYAGSTTIAGTLLTGLASATLFAQEGVGLTSTNVALQDGGILAMNGTFSRSIGTGANQVRWITGAGNGRGGFAAIGGPLAIQLNGGTSSITFGGGSGNCDNLSLGSVFSTHTADLQNGLTLPATANDRRITVQGYGIEQIISGTISGGASGVKLIVGAGSCGILTLTGNNTFNAAIEITGGAGVLRLGHANALGPGTAAIALCTGGAGFLDLNGYSLTARPITMSNISPIQGRGAIMNSSATESVIPGNITLSTSLSAFGGNGPIRLTGSLIPASGVNVTKVGTGRLTLAGTVTFSGTAALTARNGTVVVDYTTDNSAKNLGAGAGVMGLQGAAFELLGNSGAASSFSIPNLKAQVGASCLIARSGNNQPLTVALGAIARDSGGVIDFNVENNGTGVATLTTTTTTLFNGLLRDNALSHSGYATVNGGRTWATVSGGSIVGLAAYALNDFTTANVNVDITGNQTASGSSTPNSWRFNDTAGGSSVTIGAAAVVQLGGTSGIGGLLMTPDAAGDVLITGGTLRGFANGDVVLHQYNTNYVLQIASLLGNSTDANNQALTKAGPGTVYLANPAQQFTGPVRITGGTLRVDKLANAGSNSSIGRGGNVRMTVLTGGGRLLFTGSGNDSTDRGFLMEGDGVIDVSGSGTLTLGPQGSTAAVNSAVDVTSGLPNVDDVNDLTLQGSGAGVATGVIRLGTRPSEAASGVYIRPGGFLAGNLIKQGSGSWTLSGAESVCQLLEVREGTVVLNHPRNTLVDNANITISGGATLAMGTNTDKVGVVTLVSGSITGPGTLQGLRFDVQNGVINANLAGILTALTKTGGGTVALNGTCTYEQATVVQGGTLEGTGSLASAVTVQNGGTLGAGAGGLGAFTLGGLAIQAGGKLAIDVGAGGNTHDSFTVNGPVALGGELLVTSPDNATDKALPIITASGAITGTLAAPPRYSVSVVGNTVYLNLPAPTGTVLLVR